MTVAAGFRVELVAAEPLIRQPVAIEFDDRGRLWVIQYLQYPNPAGLKRVKVDRYSRTEYDRVPPPPPDGPLGDDRVTILADADGDGRTEKAVDFVRGLNLCSSLAFGHGGVFLLQAPYLLFYPDRNRDDVPDEKPEVLLQGFGLQDAHSVANSLMWGPDGWLYGCQGSTVTSRIRGIEFQQGVWRYHPKSRRFELFCEGGGNSWGLDFDADGQLLYCTNHGGYVALHGEQGAYYWKSFGKHGALHNPHAFGYFDHVPHQNFKGGHVSVGGIIYQSDLFPPSFRGKLIAADLLGHGLYWHALARDGSTFQSSHGGELLVANDTWFAPSDVTTGPGGAVYVSDWHDQRTAHPDPDADWDRRNGRVYRVLPVKADRDTNYLDPRDRPDEELLAELHHSNQWRARRARRVLVERADSATFDGLRRDLITSNDTKSLAKLWTYGSARPIDDELAARLLASDVEAIRRWTVRFIGDAEKTSDRAAAELVALAKREKSPVVRAQLAQTAKRLDGAGAIDLIAALLETDAADLKDRHLPLLLWWAIEAKAISDREAVLDVMTRPSIVKGPLARREVIPRLVRRYAAEGNDAGYAACRRLIDAAPDDRAALLGTLAEALADKRFERPPAALGPLVANDAGKARSAAVEKLAIVLGDGEAVAAAVQGASDPRAPLARRVALVNSLAAANRSAVAPLAVQLLDSRDATLRRAAIDAIGRVGDAGAATALAKKYPALDALERPSARAILFRRAVSALALLDLIEKKQVPADEVARGELADLAMLKADAVDASVKRIWGRFGPATPEEKLAEARRLSNDLRAFPGDPAAGRDLYRKHCATCHQLFGEGSAVGPELTTANRKDRQFLLLSLVDPSAQIRKEYVAYAAQLSDGQVLTGLLVEQTPTAVTLLTAKNERVTVVRADIEQLTELPTSLMPEKLLLPLSPRELRDLFSYLESDRPPR